jgi:glycosyltransferase involved in cell wall biosynthesis
MVRVLNIVSLQLGGTETTIMNYYRHINRSKIQFDFYVSAEAEKHYYEEEAVSLGARIFRQPPKAKRLFKPIEALSKVPALYRLLKDNPDISIVQYYGSTSLTPILYSIACILAGVKVRVVYSGGVRLERVSLHRLLRPLLRIVATHKTAGSFVAGKSMFGKGIKKNLIITPRARDLEAFRFSPQQRKDIRKELNFDGKLVIVHVARLGAVKNQCFLIDAFAHALSLEPEMILLLVGDGEMRKALEDKAQELNLGKNVRFLGERVDIHGFLQAADVFALTSFQEGMPGVIIEAQAAGLPCLLSDTVPREIQLTEHIEFLPINKGPEIWAKRMIAYKGFDRRDTFENLRKAGYDIRDAAKWLENLYLEALER